MVCSVLVVDDNPDILQLVSEYLLDNSYAVETAKSAAEALGVIRGGHVPQILISDIVMPGTIDGVELAKLVKKAHPEIGILLMTGWSLDQDHNFTCLSKPFHLPEITNWIEEFFASTEGK